MKQNLRYKKLLGILFIIFLVIFTFIKHFQEYSTYIFEDNIQNSMEITNHNEIIQEFICEYDGLNALQILFTTNERINNSTLFVELLQDDKCIQKYDVKESLIADNIYLILRLDHKIESKGQKYILRLTSDAISGNGVTPLKYKLQYSTLQHKDSYRPFILIQIFVILLCFISIIYCCKKTISIEKSFILLWCVFSILYACSNTMYNVPDESHHFYRAYEISIGHMISEMNDEGTKGGRELPLVDTGFNSKYWQTFKDSLDSRLSKEVVFKNFSNTALYAPISYIPQATGILLARLITDRLAIITYAGRCANWMCITLILYFAIKLLPFGKEFLSLILLMPMNMHEAFSLSPDGMVVAVSVFMIAFVMYLRYVQKNYLSIFQIILLYLLAIVISLYKIVYLPFCLIYFLIPKERFSSIKQKIIHAVIVAVTTILIALIWLQICNKFLTHIGANSSLQIANIVHHPIIYATTIFRTYAIYSMQLLHQMVGSTLGQLTVNVNSIIVMAYIFMLFYKLTLYGRISIDRGREYEKCIFGIVIFFIVLLISTSIYVQWTWVGENLILGLQGRYFISLLLPLYFMVTKATYIDNGENEQISFVALNLAFAFNACSGIAILFYCLE